jgi:hypothetical protein
MKSKARMVIMSTIVTSLVGFALVQWFQRRGILTVHRQDDFGAMMAAAPPSKKPRDLNTIVHSPDFATMSIEEHAALLNEMICSLVRPGMGNEEVIHVRSALIAPVTSILALSFSNAISGGESSNGNGSRTESKTVNFGH